MDDTNVGDVVEGETAAPVIPTVTVATGIVPDGKCPACGRDTVNSK